MKLKSSAVLVVSLATGVASAAGLATQSSPSSLREGIVSTSPGTADRVIPLVGWDVDVLGTLKKLNAAKSSDKGQTKAATDPAAVYRPVTPCRLVDTRGNGAPVQGGPFNPGERRTIAPAGRCGIPTSFVRAVSLSFHTFNYTVNNGGYIALAAPGTPVAGINDVFNVGAQWSASTSNVPTSLDGSFDVFVAQSRADVIIDVNGYYQDLDSLDVGSTELDIFGTSTGDLFEVTQSGTGSAITGGNQTGGPAFTIAGGTFRVAGAGVNTSTAAFIHQASGCAAGSGFSAINNPLINGDPNALLIITPRSASSNGPFRVEYNACGSNLWTIHDLSGSAITGQFNVMIIKS
ncbi:MAG: hypothetical protein M3Z31_02325 [Pseudomonadota bacterium]|nr:hypothetical protein [Pseudomonadota bacterium]